MQGTGSGYTGFEYSWRGASAGTNGLVGYTAALPAETGLQLRDTLQRKGVQWVFKATVDRVEQGRGRLRPTLSDGDAFDTDLVLSAAGLVA